ncbi:MAG: antitoxin family protein [Dehalococcoidia bacterium]|nr:antitoxin family protein [Dehalococcoidia bacterium]
MSTIQAIYENGVLKPLQKLDIPERQKVEIIILADDLPSSLIAEVAEQSSSYTFLSYPGEDVYTGEDGEGVG